MKSHDFGTLPPSVIYHHYPSRLARETFFYPLHLGHYFCDGSYCVDRTSFDSFLLMYVMRGSGFVSAGEGLRNLSEGDLVLVDCYAPHRYYTKNGWEIYWIHFDGISARKCYEYAATKGTLIQHAANSLILRKFELLLDRYERTSIADEAYLSKLINDILTEVMMQTGNGHVQPQKAAIIDESIKYICDNLDKDLPLELLAQHAMLSPFHFARLFKEETGQTPHQYLLSVRLDYARFLLRTGNLPVQNVAYRCGFSSSGSFCSSFRKHTGMSPNSYRRKR